MPPVIPAVIAFAGTIWGLFNLTLGQDPSNALPHWSPAIGWSASLGSLALASVLVWIGLVRRKCPECGSTQMLDAMEEEGLIASERLAAQKAAVDEALAGLGQKAPAESEGELRARIEAELRATQAKENADRLAAREKELREDVERHVRAEHERQSAESERVLRKKLEEELRSQIELKLRAEIERQGHTSQTAPLPLSTTPAPAPVREAPPARSPTAARATTPPPITTARAIAASTAPQAAARPATPAPITTAKAIGVSTTPHAATKPVTPAPLTTAKAIGVSTTPHAATKPVTPAPITTAKAIAGSTVTPGPVPTAASQGAAKNATPAPSAVEKTAQPAAPHAKVETAPLALMASSAGRARSPAAAVSVPAPSPQTVPPATDGHERARRRARVILSDLAAYHRDELVKAAAAADPRKELGTLWRDAVISYNEVASPEIRSVTNYLEEELDRYLVRLRSA